MSAHIYLLYGRGDWFIPQRISATIGNALIFAHLLAFLVIIIRDNPLKPLWLRLVFGFFVGMFLGALVWYSHLFLYLYQPMPDFSTLVFGGIGLSFGFLVSGSIQIENRWIYTIFSILITSISIYILIFLTHQAYRDDASAQALLYFQADNPNDVFFIGLPFAMTIAFFSHLPLLFSSSPRADS